MRPRYWSAELCQGHQSPASLALSCLGSEELGEDHSVMLTNCWSPPTSVTMPLSHHLEYQTGCLFLFICSVRSKAREPHTPEDQYGIVSSILKPWSRVDLPAPHPLLSVGQANLLPWAQLCVTSHTAAWPQSLHHHNHIQAVLTNLMFLEDAGHSLWEYASVNHFCYGKKNRFFRASEITMRHLSEATSWQMYL